MPDFQESEAVDVNRILEELEKIDNLDALDEIENMLLSEKQNKTQMLNSICERNAQLRDELNAAKCLIKELDQVHKDKLEKMENLREQIKVRQQEVLQEQTQQLEDLDQFEMDVDEITTKIISAPEEYEGSRMLEKIDNMMKVLDERKGESQQKMEEVAKAQKEFEELVERPFIDSALEVFDDTITGITTYENNLAQSLDEMKKEFDRLRYDIKTINIKQLNFGKN